MANVIGTVSSGIIKGKVSGTGFLKGIVSSPGNIVGKVVIKDSYSVFEGPYSVVSAPFSDTVYETDDMVMSSDLTVRKIPYESVTNPQGGKTVNIGGN